MSKTVSRRDFLKLAAVSAGAASVLTGCGPAARYVRRQPYGEMPEYTLVGQKVLYATTCGECPAGCGLIARTQEGRAHKVEGNPDHPVSHGNSCARGQATLQGLYNPDRVKGPLQQNGRGSGAFTDVDWTAAVNVVKDALAKYQPAEIAFVMGLFPDHLHDLVSLMSQAAGGMNVLRYTGLGEFEGRVTLMDAARKLFGAPKLPYFDIERAEVTFSFGANFTETWISPVAYAYDYGVMRRGYAGQRGYLVQFEPRMSQTGANADEWFPIRPGSEASLAQALAYQVGINLNGAPPAAVAKLDLAAACEACGVSEPNVRRLARLFSDAPRRVAIPGGIPLGSTNGLAAAEAILFLNSLVDNLGKDGGLFLMPDSPLHPEVDGRPSTAAEMAGLAERIAAGQVKAVFVHGANPVFSLPKTLGFAEALGKAELVVSFASFMDETAALADYVFPDHTPLESWGYQKVQTGAGRITLSGLQPVVTPVYNTRATADVLLAAVQAAGGAPAAALPFSDEVAFLQQTVYELNDLGGPYTAPDAAQFWLLWLQHGGWQQQSGGLMAPANMLAADAPLQVDAAQFGEGELHLLVFPHPNLGDGSQANRPVLQETPDPTTTVMWNTWVEINPETAHELGLTDDDLVEISSPSGKIEVPVYLYPAIRPDTVAVPLGQGHTAFGRYAQGRGVNPLDLLGGETNASGGLAFMAARVKVTATGRRRALSRYESKAGVYGTGEHG
ncbi:MAG: molybdopterin-dependent oxidoreductase [Chloroflexota bacterium]